jgi:hypothetical protein
MTIVLKGRLLLEFMKPKVIQEERVAQWSRDHGVKPLGSRMASIAMKNPKPETRNPKP